VNTAGCWLSLLWGGISWVILAAIDYGLARFLDGGYEGASDRF
jgi:hypothetical protein